MGYRTVQLKLLPTSEQAEALAATLQVCNAAVSALAHGQQNRSKPGLQKKVYHRIKEELGLSAQSAIRVIGKVADAYTTLTANLTAGRYGAQGSRRRRRVEATPVAFHRWSAQPFDAAACPGNTRRGQCRSGPCVAAANTSPTSAGRRMCGPWPSIGAGKPIWCAAGTDPGGCTPSSRSPTRNPSLLPRWSGWTWAS